MTHFSEKELNLLSTILDELTLSLEHREVRKSFASNLMQLLNADFFASYSWSENDEIFTDGIGINMPESHLKEYETFFQHHDPISHKLQQYKRAVNVNEIIDQRDLLQTSFYNDFLKRDGLYWGINLYAYHQEQNIGDIRVWRKKGKEPFSHKEMEILNIILPIFKNSLIHSKSLSSVHHKPTKSELLEHFSLTSREAEIAQLIIEGKMDERIAADLNISFHTVRSHIKNIFRKLNICNRSSLIKKALCIK